MTKYDLLILGGGPGGYVCAERAAVEGLSVAIIEKENLGGVCLNEGCIPLKSLLNAAKMYEHATLSQSFGVEVTGATFNSNTAQKRKNDVITTLVSGVKKKLKQAGITVINGQGVIEKREDNGFIVTANKHQYYCNKLVIATGSEPIIPNIEGLKEGYESGFVATSKEMLNVSEKLEDLVVIGGGAIGLEMASYFNSIGTKVTIIEMFDHIAGNVDIDISKSLQKSYTEKGIIFLLGSKVEKIGDNSITYISKGEEYTISTSKVLLSIGRKPNIRDIGLENIGIEIKNGAIVTNDMLRTNVANVYAIGDVNGKLMLAHTAYREAEVAVNDMMGKVDMIRYRTIPSVIYTNPEVAFVGDTKETAEERGIEVYVIKTSMQYSGRYVAETINGEGFCKLVISKNDNRILGVHLIGNTSSEIIFGAVLMIEMELCINELKELVFPHPSVCEVIREAFFQ